MVNKNQNLDIRSTSLSAKSISEPSGSSVTEHTTYLTFDDYRPDPLEHPTITKSNLLIQSLSRFTKNEQKLLGASICRINPWTPVERIRQQAASQYETDVESQLVGFKVHLTSSQISELTGMDLSNINKFIDKATDSFLSNPIQRITPVDGGEKITKFNVATFCEYDTAKNLFTIAFNPLLTQDLAEFHGGFTSYRMSYYASLPTKYSLQLYEIFHSLAFRKGGTLLLFDKENLNASLYFNLGLVELDEDGDIKSSNAFVRTYTTFKNRVLMPAIDAINQKTNLTVSITNEHRRGRSMHSITFLVLDDSSNEMISTQADELGVSRHIIQRLVSKHGRDRVQRNLNLMSDGIEKGIKYRNPPGYLNTLIEQDFANLPEKLNPLSPSNVGNKILASFLSNVLIKVYRRLPAGIQVDVAEFGIDSVYVALIYQDFVAQAEAFNIRTALAAFSVTEVTSRIMEGNTK